MPKVKLTIGRVFCYLVATFLVYFRISYDTLWAVFSQNPSSGSLKHFQFVLDQNLGHFEASLYDCAEIVMQAILWLECIFDLKMPLEDGQTRPDYLRPPCAPSFIKSGLIRILHQYFTHSLYTYAARVIKQMKNLSCALHRDKTLWTFHNSREM